MVVRFQEKVGLDLLVHGEPERNDMVQYFGEQLNGFVFTQNAWVQSYGSRYGTSLKFVCTDVLIFLFQLRPTPYHRFRRQSHGPHDCEMDELRSEPH